MNRTTHNDPQLQQLVQDLLACKPERIILFGSIARGDADQYSDYDVIVIQQTERPFVQRLLQVGALLTITSRVDLLVYTPAEFQRMIEEDNPLIRKALEEGVTLYERLG